MKHRIKKHLSLIIALSMLLSLIPFYGAAVDDEFAGYETLEEIPFEFELEPGDLPFEQLKDAVLAAEDIPACIDPALAEARGHVNRLYLQEPDDYTVMFQNRDGSKTIYVFSHPVKGMTASMTAAIQVNGSVVSFTGTNAITSRIAELSDYNIGYSEVAYIPNGILSADGIDLTEDARGWARGESMPSALSYNISSEAAAEYAASVSVPNTDVATAAVAPGVTITPNDPAPLGGMTVMSISYSTLAGLMSLKNMATNRYLTMTNSSSPSLSTSSSISAPYSRWFVQYDSMRGYVLSNINNVFNTYLGRMSGQSTLTIGPKSSIDYVFGLTIVSTYDSTVTIGFNDYAIDSTLSIYQRNPDDDTFPTACEWKIYNKQDITLVSGINCSATRTEESGTYFYNNYTLTPSAASYYDIALYYADTDQMVEHDTEVSENDEVAYCITTPGTYTVYYKDSVTGIQSQNFTLTIVTDIAEINLPSDTRIEQKGVGFSPLYILEPSAYLSPYDIRLYYASDDTEVGKNTAWKYVINTAGVYTVYYKDSVSGVTSDDFTILVYEQESFDSKYTYMIQPMNALNQFLTMTVTADAESNDLSLSPIGYSKQGLSEVNNAEKWNDKSKTFTIRIDESNSAYYNISATLAMNQYNDTDDVDANEYTGTYTLVDLNSSGITNSISCDVSNNNELTTKLKTDASAEMRVLKVNDSYVIICGINGNSEYVALKYVYNVVKEKYEVEAAVFNPTMEEFRWKITHVGVDIPCIKQTRDFVCGYTTLLQVIMGADLDITVDQSFIGTSGDTEYDLDAKMKTVWKITHNMNGSADQLYINNYLHTLLQSDSVTNTNSLDPVICNKDSSVSSTTDQALYDKLIGSMRTGLAPWIFTRKAYSPYTASDSGAHYIAIAGVYYSEDNNPNNDFVIISNCHYVNGVHGIYVIPYSDFRTACQNVNGVEQYLYYCESVNNGG